MITVKYHSPFEDAELHEGETYRSISPVGQLCLSSEPEEIKVNDAFAHMDENGLISCDGHIKISVHEGDVWHQYSIQPLYACVEEKDARAYIDFFAEKSHCQTAFQALREIECIQLGQLHLFDRQSLELADNEGILTKLTDTLSALQNICKRPKSHLKSVNEIRPIDAVKRIGHEAIPYLASHNEDWEARTATGLKPARLFSRTEDDDYQIYENRVVKTEIDMALRFLRRLCRNLQQTKDQLNGILMSAVVSTASFGFDLSHQKCVNSMMGRDEDSNEDYEEQSNLAKKVSEELKQATQLLRRYRELKQSRLYRLLHKVKPITGNLMPTNILRMDKNYHKVYLAWPELMKVMHTIDTMPRIGESGAAITGEEMQSSYSEFIETIVGFAAHSLSFEEVEHNHFLRSTDDVFMQIHPNDDGLLIMDIGREIDYRITVTGQLESPIAPGATDGIFSFDGKTIHWHSKAGDGDIEYFARKLKTRESRGAQRAEEARRYRSLKVALTAENDSKDARVYRVLIVPSITALDDQSQIRYVDDMRAKMTGMIEKNNVNMAVVCMPLCRPNEQAVTNYGYQSDGNIALLPVSMFDINSYRRFRLTLLRFIAEITDNCCPCCGNIATKDKNGGLVCYSCDNLQVITTTCLNEKCGRSFKYLNYGISADVRRKMYEESISDKSDESSFFRHDSLFQYKNIVPMSVNPNKIGPICPFCATLE